MNKLNQRIFAALAFSLLISALGMLAYQFTSLEWMIAHETQMKQFVRWHPWWSWGIGLVLYTTLSLVPGAVGKSFVCGWIFGFWSGTLMADMSLTIAAMFTFSISRFLLRETIQDRFGTYLAPFQRSLESNVGYYLLMLRLIHTPFSFVNYGAGATINVPMKTFWWTTQLGLLPATMIFVYAGTRLPSLASMAEQGVFSLLDSHLILALLAAPALTWLVRQIVRHTGMFRSIVD